MAKKYKRRRVYFEPPILKEIEERANRKGKSFQDEVRETLKNGLKTQLSGSPKLKPIPNAFPNTRCSNPNCNREIGMNEIFYWGRNAEGKTISLCQDCYLMGVGDKTIVNLVIKKRKLKRTVKAFRNEIDNLAPKYESREFLEQEQEALDLLREMQTFFLKLQSTVSYHKAVKGSTNIEPLEHRIDAILSFTDKAEQYINDLRSFREKYLGIKTKKKPRKKSRSTFTKVERADPKPRKEHSLGNTREKPVDYDPFRQPQNG